MARADEISEARRLLEELNTELRRHDLSPAERERLQT